MSFVNIISAIGNNSSIYPLLVRDCGIEVPSKVILTYAQNTKESKEMAKHATRERFIDEYGTSVIWLGGIPAVEAICNKIITKNGYNPFVNPKLFKEEEKQGLEYNIKKFKDIAPEEVKDLLKVKNNRKTFEKLLSAKFVASTAIPIALMGVVLPKLNFKLTKKKIQKVEINSVNNTETKNNEVSFKGISSVLANATQLQKMAVTDGGLTVGRVGTARNKNEKIEMGFKMALMMIINFVTPKYIQKGLDSLSKNIFGTKVDIDPLILNDKEFLNQIKNKSFVLPKNKNEVIDFIDKNPNSKFTEYAKKFCGVKFIKNSQIRDPRYYVNEEKINTLSENISEFANFAGKSGNIEKYTKKALKIKTVNIFANIAISSLLLAVGIPKVQFMLRKKISGTDIDPGLISNN